MSRPSPGVPQGRDGLRARAAPPAGPPAAAAAVASRLPAQSGQPRRVPAASAQPLEGLCEEQLPPARHGARVEEDGLLSGWTDGAGTWASCVLHWALAGLLGTFHRGRAPAWPPQPTWAHARKAGMSLTGTFLVSAFTRRFRSSVSSTTSRRSRMGSSVGTRERGTSVRAGMRGLW